MGAASHSHGQCTSHHQIIYEVLLWLLMFLILYIWLVLAHCSTSGCWYPLCSGFLLLPRGVVHWVITLTEQTPNKLSYHLTKVSLPEFSFNWGLVKQFSFSLIWHHIFFFALLRSQKAQLFCQSQMSVFPVPKTSLNWILTRLPTSAQSPLTLLSPCSNEFSVFPLK